jgi:hypothetical protein
LRRSRRSRGRRRSRRRIRPSTSRRRARRGKLQGGVHLHPKCTVSLETLAGSSSEFSKTGWGWRRWKEDAKEIAGNYLLTEIESDFIFLFF